MKTLAYLLASNALDVARASEPQASRPEPALPPIASTPETAAAWRRWAAAARQDSDGTERRATVAPERRATDRHPA